MGSSRRYGPPLYSAAWVPLNKISATEEEEEEEKDEAEARGADAGHEGEDMSEGLQREEAASEEGQASGGSETSDSRGMVLLSGGGGEGRSGVPNALLLAEFDPASVSLKEEPLFKLGLEGELPYRMAVHPAGQGVVCSFPTCCRWFKWKLHQGKLALASGRLLTELDDGVMQLALAFNGEGTMLATGNEDGRLRVFKWPRMELIIDESAAHKAVNNLDFSLDGKFLASVGGKDEPCRVWNLTSSTAATALPRENGENFRFCRFSETANHKEILYVIAIQGDRTKVLTWDPLEWRRIGSKLIARDPVSAFSVSADGNLLAFGTIEGQVIVANSSGMQILSKVKAHMGLVTALSFQEPRVLLSTSFDATANVIAIKDERKTGGLKMWVVFLTLILALLLYYLQSLRAASKDD